MVTLADDVGRMVRHYIDRHAGYAMARLREDASIALAQEDWSRFKLLERTRLRMVRLQCLAGRYPGSIAAKSVASVH